MNYSKRFSWLAVPVATALVGCASTPPPKELLDARATYERAHSGAAGQLAPDRVEVARLSLVQAEDAYKKDPSAPSTVDLAYVAERKAEMAEVAATTIQANKSKTMTEEELKQQQATDAQRTKGELSMTKQQLADQTTALAAQTQKTADAERRAKEAMDAVARIAAVKEDQRGTIITLSGSVLFASGKSELLPVAREKLTQVAAALKENEGRSMVVQGYTDSVGVEQANMDLSLRRAQSVREYLITQGIVAERITAEGKGPANPVADNKTADGRADNRRVEIVVQPKAAAAHLARSARALSYQRVGLLR